MVYQSVAPPPSLAPYVRCCWWLEGNDASYIHRSMADVCPELIFHYKGCFTDLLTNEASFTSGLHGQSDTFQRFAVTGHFGIFGVYLYPHAIPVLLGLPATELSNQLIDLSLLPGKEYDRLEDQMMLAADNYQRVKIIIDFLRQRLIPVPTQQPGMSETINFIINTRGQHSVKALAQKHFLSQRQFERNFRAGTGFSPKRFSRIARFQAVLQHYDRPVQSLTALAYHCGYYDQSHFIHDFKAFSGHHPRHYFSGNAEGTEWKD